MKNEKVGIFRQFWITFFRPDQYGRLAYNGTGRMVGFVFLFSFLYLVVWAGSLMLTLDMDGLKKVIREEIPDFYLENGELHMDEPYNIAASGLIICADSEIERFELSDLEYIRNSADYEAILLVSKQNLLRYTARDGKFYQLDFSNLKGKKYTRDGLLDMGEAMIQRVLMLIPFFIFPFMAIIHFVFGLFLAIIAMLFSALFGKHLSGGQVYRIGIHVYAMILMVGLVFEVYLITVPTGIAQFIYFVLGVAYLIVGVLSTGSYAAANRQDMAQRAAAQLQYGGYGESGGGGYYVQDAFSNEPIGFTGQESQTAGTNRNGNQYYAGNVNAGSSQFNSSPENANQQFYSGSTYNANTYNSNTYNNTYDSAKVHNPESDTKQEGSNSYGMDMAFYGMNVIGRDGTMQTVNSEKEKFENKQKEVVEEVAAEDKESSISHHKGLATNVISFEGTEPFQAYPPVKDQAEDTVMINGVRCPKSELDLVDKYLLVGLQDSAIDNLCQLLNCTKEAAQEVAANWKQYYNE